MVLRRAVLAAGIVAALIAEPSSAEIRCGLAPDGTLHVANVPVTPPREAVAAAFEEPAFRPGCRTAGHRPDER